MSDFTVDLTDEPDAGPLDLDQVSQQVRDKAGTLRVIDEGEGGWTVVSGENTYTVRIDGGLVSCTCPWGRNHASGRVGCSHAVAAILRQAFLESQP